MLIFDNINSQLIKTNDSSSDYVTWKNTQTEKECQLQDLI